MSGKAHVTSRNTWVLTNFSWLEGHAVVRTHTSQLGVIGNAHTIVFGTYADDVFAIQSTVRIVEVPGTNNVSYYTPVIRG